MPNLLGLQGLTLWLQAASLDPLAGNPFFLIQFFETVHKEGLIWFEPDDGTWAWQLRDALGVEVRNYSLVGYGLDQVRQRVATAHSSV